MFELNTRFCKEKDCYFKVKKLGKKPYDVRVDIMSETSGPMMTVNVSSPCANFPKELAIKSYSENEGLYEELLRLGFINPAKSFIHSGYAILQVCDLNYDKMEEHIY